ncbi:nuclear transport factor 2 family protein [Streptomyces acidiscabies]|uniref:Nuclear transport factor 2 family protein n=1 Tax=Streptomyces acidiscabies TaxID=42234 RepID=A0AAP6BBK5_9ACTN|nr:nuclear transport factor 2 family protein [Streptomyces acidiscabies]MBP5942465.1 nuclear transport factor 2 family protein [Streptomyces sp. LBUM 1476]MBZ3917784.1 nuclear transport factor 2 family protein [Streptomyces acidiscabies]MDX2961754.1 nuclear transport factor 2 family protein [Streptomyces acidiscabies]MDX3023499.1 nuclear transport factor 2 family protein [Streptomyces acidiscabies]MDX3789295.1 nuclear transport factor 2 family protein [Streptomyces acidiscabies]
MTSTNIDLARTYFQAVQTGDMATLGDLLDEAITWHQPGANQFSGDHNGQGAVFQMLGGMMEASQGTFAIDEVHTVMTNGDLVTATIHFTGRRGDTSMSMDGVDVLRIENGKITEMWLFSEDPAAEDAFWG